MAPILRQISECFIKPNDNANKIVHLAPWDLFMLSIHYIQKGLFFPKPHVPMETLVAKLKDSLSIALVHFYSLTGQFETRVDKESHTSVVFIDCNKGPGARFLNARLDLTIRDLQSSKYGPKVANSLFDHHKNVINYDGHTLPLMTIQVTELIDGVFIACSINHACVDGASYWHFFNMWSEIFMAQGDINTPISRPPVYNRWFLDGSGPVKLPYTSPEEFVGRFQIPPFLERTFHFSAKSIANLKALANSDCETANKISSFQALAALVWRCITKARATPHYKHVYCGLAINDRGRLNPPLSQDYFGNSAQMIHVIVKAGELMSRSLGWTAMLLHEVVVGHDDKKVRESIETWMKDPKIAQIGSPLDLGIVLFGSSPRFDMYGPEFGMGKALAVINGQGCKLDGKVTSAPGRDEEGSVDLEVCLSADSMSALELDHEFAEACLIV